jgi:RNA polymerase sigma factor (sigma-70 family)
MAEAKAEENQPGRVRPLARGTLKLQSDERLLKLFRRGIEPAFEELINRYRGALVAYAGSIAGFDRAEDVVQDSLVKAHRSLRDDRDIDPRSWLYAVVRNTALNDVRDNRKHRHDGLGEHAGGGASPVDVVEQREHFAAVLAAVADLPPAQRRALVDHELSGFSHEEIAAELELSTGATKQLIYRARISLRNAFGAMIPLPLIAWLAEGSGVIATGAAGGGATATGLIGGIGGGSAAKLAVVAVVAGGSLAGGIAVEKHHMDRTGPANAAQAAETSDANAEAFDAPLGAGGSEQDAAALGTVAIRNATADDSRGKSRKSESGTRDEGDEGQGSGDDGFESNGNGSASSDSGKQPNSSGNGSGGSVTGNRPLDSSGPSGGRHEPGGGYDGGSRGGPGGGSGGQGDGSGSGPSGGAGSGDQPSGGGTGSNGSGSSSGSGSGNRPLSGGDSGSGGPGPSAGPGGSGGSGSSGSSSSSGGPGPRPDQS